MGYKGWENFNPNAGKPKKPDPKRQYQGHKSRELGAEFEEYIKAACEVYRLYKLAEVEKTPEPFKVMGKKRQLQNGAWGFEGVFTSAAQPDFKGTLRGGRSVVFEAKASETGRIAKDVVTAEQARALTSHEALGAVAFVLVSLSLRDFYRVPWRIWQDMKALYGHKFMTAEELEEYRVSFKNGFLHIFQDLEVTNENRQERDCRQTGNVEKSDSKQDVG